MQLPEEKFSEDALGWLDFFKHQTKKHWPEAQMNWKYGVPFWQFKGKEFCYFNANKKEVYVSFIYPPKTLKPYLDKDGKTMTAKFYLSGHGKLNIPIFEALMRQAAMDYIDNF